MTVNRDTLSWAPPIRASVIALIFLSVMAACGKLTDPPAPKGSTRSGQSPGGRAPGQSGAGRSDAFIKVNIEEVEASLAASKDATSAESEGSPGQRLYDQNCKSCHGSSKTSSKRGRSVEEIAEAIKTNPTMKAVVFLRELSEPDLSLIAEVLGSVEIPEESEKPTLSFEKKTLLGNRHYIASILESAFLAPGGENTTVQSIIDENVKTQTTFYGGPCGHKSGACQPNRLISSGAATLPQPTAARSGYLLKACEGILSVPGTAQTALKRAGLTQANQSDDSSLRAAMRLFLPNLVPQQEQIEALGDLHQAASQSGDQESAWTLVLLNLCISADTGLEFNLGDANDQRSSEIRVFDRCFAQLTQTAFNPQAIFDIEADARERHGEVAYQENCASCHGTLPTTTKAGRTAQAIRAAIQNNPTMKALPTLVGLTGEEIEGIASALGSGGADATKAADLQAIRDAVVAGDLSGPDGCLRVVDYADLSGQETILTANPIGRRVLNNLHSLHASWMRIKNIPSIEDFVLTSGSRAIFDAEQPAFYYTLALFDDEFPFRNIMLTSNNLGAHRTDTTPDYGSPDIGRYTVIKDRSKRYGSIFTPVYFAPQGELLGIEKNQELTLEYEFVSKEKLTQGTMNPTEHYGGGIPGLSRISNHEYRRTSHLQI